VAGCRAEIVAEIRKPPIPDLVLLDVMMPDADGFDILLRIRSHPALKDVPVIMLTAKASREAVLKGLAGGADGYITKPVETESLLQAVRTVVGLQ
ncbi:MAG TPA: response regulator, partial [Polaromonas sp.]|nr:response regulator [Polaromonas sp.]